jgi:hypothetical protein
MKKIILTVVVGLSTTFSFSQSIQDSIYIKASDLAQALIQNPREVQNTFNKRQVYLEGYLEVFDINRHTIIVKGLEGKPNIECSVKFKKENEPNWVKERDSLETSWNKNKGLIRIVLYGQCKINIIGGNGISYNGATLYLDNAEFVSANIQNQESESTAPKINNLIQETRNKSTISASDLIKKYPTEISGTTSNFIYVQGTIKDVLKNFRNSSTTAIILETGEKDKFIRCLEIMNTPNNISLKKGDKVILSANCCGTFSDYSITEDKNGEKNMTKVFYVDLHLSEIVSK